MLVMFFNSHFASPPVNTLNYLKQLGKTRKLFKSINHKFPVSLIP